MSYLMLRSSFSRRVFTTACIVTCLFSFAGFSQTPHESALTLREAVEMGVRNYSAIRAKQNYLHAAEAATKNSRNEYLPNVIASAQQNYGTVNGQYGPMAPVGALGVASAGPAYAEQNWNAAFGAAYIISVNWELFSFGRVRSRIQASEAQMTRDSADLEQERFVHKIRIASAYLNVLVARQLVASSRSNLERVRIIEQSVKARTLSGLNPGVDSSLVNAEVSRAKLSLIGLVNNMQGVEQQLADLLDVRAGISVVSDTSFYSMIPGSRQSQRDMQNPQLTFFQKRVEYERELSDVVKRSVMPGLTVFGVYQGRASGFTSSYNPENFSGYSSRYWDGISPSRYNYVAGVSLTWNLMSPLKIRQQVHAQKFIAAGYQEEFNALNRQLQNQHILSEQRMQNSLETAREAPVQYQAASEAYLQKSVLYANGLTTMVDLQQALYALNRAEIDRSVANINVWHALLMISAATGDFDLFINQVR